MIAVKAIDVFSNSIILTKKGGRRALFWKLDNASDGRNNTLYTVANVYAIDYNGIRLKFR